MDYFNDLEQRIGRIIKNERLMFNIGDIVRITGLKPSQIHYWERKGYLKSIKRSKNHNHLYSHVMLIKIEIMKSYLKSGFTLSMANQKASRGYHYSNLFRQVVLNRFCGVTKVNGQLALDFGPVDDNRHQELLFVIKSDGKVETKLVNH